MTLILSGTDNSATAPVLTGGTGGTSTGQYFPATNQWAVSTNGTQAMLVDASQNVTLSGTLYANLPNTFGFKNRFINGAMVIDQKNAGAAITQTTSRLSVVDRWQIYGSIASKFTAQQNAGAVTPPAGFNNYLGITSSSAYSIAATDIFYLTQWIEGFNFADMSWGTANAQTVTLSFWVRSSLTGTFGGTLVNSAENRSYPFTYSIAVANTWEKKSITIAGDTSGTWIGATNGVGLKLFFGLGVGTTYSGTAGAWAGALYLSATGATSVVGTNAATFYITGVQLEKGSMATLFDYRSYGTELGLCLRYYQTLPGIVVNPAASWLSITYVTPMRANPTVSGGGGGFTIDSASVYVGNFYQTTRAAQTITLSAEF